MLGIHFGHDATVVLIKDGKVLEAMSEERLTRLKKYSGFPNLSLTYIKEKYRIDHFPKVVVVGLLEFSHGAVFATKEQNESGRNNPQMPRHFLRAVFMKFPFLRILIKIRHKLLIKRVAHGQEEKTKEFLSKRFPGSHIDYIHHHLAHAYAAVPFMESHERKVVLTCDGAGDDAAASVCVYEEGKMEMMSKTHWDHSLGLLYCGVVDILGMKRNEHEFKVMGLAPYAKVSSGEKVYERLKKIIRYNQDTQTIVADFPMIWSTEYLIMNEFFHHRFDSLAYGVQKLTENILCDMVRNSLKRYSTNKLAIGGGVFMNVKANQRILALPEVEEFTVSPSCGDESLAIGAAVYGYCKYFDYHDIDKVPNIYWGSEYTDEQIKQSIDDYQFENKVAVEYFDPSSDITIEKRIAELLSKDNVVGRLSGRAEWGARALGNRSILANPSKMDNVKLINEMIKNRDFWMPFATSVAAEFASEYLYNEKMSLAPYMAITFETTQKAHEHLPAALHPYDKTSRPQMVTKEANPKYHSIIKTFRELTGIGGVLNTSFNLHGEPNVETPYDALRTFDLSGMRYVAVGNYLVSKV